MIIKKGAMFGLDARIALAIFGALSVISGAALFSAIKVAKAQQGVSEYTEITKALEAYLLDVGSFIPEHPTAVLYDMKELISSSSPGWNGPYISSKGASADATLEISNISDVNASSVKAIVQSYKDDQSGSYTSKLLYCTLGSDCFYWIGFKEMSTDLCTSIDEVIDGSADYGKGRYRIYNRPGNSDCWYNTGISIDQVK